MADNVVELTNGMFKDFIKKGIVLIDFYADWCMPCLMMSPIVDDVADKLGRKLKVGRVNVEEGQELAMKFKILSIPNFILFRNGEIIDKFVGSMSADELEERIKKHL